jgi:hypothetical protein
MNFVEKGSVGIGVSNDIDNYMQMRKGLRKGDPLSPILVNIIADMLAILTARAKEDGLIPHLVDGGVSILQYADDTIIFIEHDMQKTLNMKLILCIFEELLGLKINFHKREIFCFSKAKEVQDEYRILFGCEIGSLPFRYLRIPIHFRRLRNGEWKPIEDRFEKK